MAKKYKENPMFKDIANVAMKLGQYKPNTSTSPKAVDVGKYQNLGSSQPRSSSQNNLGTVTVPYGGSTRYEEFHHGVDTANKIGTPIPFKLGGVVQDVVRGKKQGDKGYGNYVIVKDAQGGLHRYSHLHNSYVRVGDTVKPGQVGMTMGNCFDKETEILTNQGWKKFKDLDKSETVATLNIDTKEIEYQKPIAYIDKIYDKMYKFNNGNKNLEFVVSEDHNMLIQLHQDQKSKLQQLKDLPNRSYIKLKDFKWTGEEIDEYTIPEIEVKVNGSNYTKIISKVVIKMDDWLGFLGWFLSDGSLCNTKKSHAVQITQSFNNIKKRFKIKKLLKKLPFNFHEYKNGDFRAVNASLHADLLKYGSKGQKCIPEFIFNLSPRQIKIFLNTYWLGDGWNHKGTKYYIFGEKKLADQVQELILKSGGYGIINEFDPLKRKNKPVINGQIINATKKYWVITDTKINYASILKDKIEEINYNDHAYCLTVDNHTLYVRRNGKAIFCGNTGSTYSLHGGTGSHLDYRIKDLYGKYVKPSEYLANYNQ